MSKTYFFASLFLILLCFPMLANAQTCEPLYDATCSPFIPLGTPIFIPPEYNLPLMQTVVNRFINGLNFLGFPEPCRSYALQLFCTTWIRPCFQVNNVTFVMPQEPCLSGCLRYVQACKPLNTKPALFGLGLYYPPGFSLPLNCTLGVVDKWANNASFWPQDSNVVLLNSTSFNGTQENYTVPCSQNTPVDIPAPIYCQSPLVVAKTTNGLKCAFECPLPSLTADQYDSAKLMQGIMGWLSWTCSALLFMALIVSPKAREFPRNLVVMTALAANIAAGAIILPTYAGYDNIWCGGSDVTVSPSRSITALDSLGLPDFTFALSESDLAIESSACTFQGAMLQFGFLAAVFWWVIIAFNMCFELYFGKLLSLNRPGWKWSRFALYMVVGWGVPFVLMVIPAAAGAIKFVPAGTYCFVTNEDNNAWSLTFWFLPVGICLLVGTVLFLAAIVRITILLITLKKVKQLIFLYLRLFIFIFLYLSLFCFIFSYNIQVADNQGSIDDGYQEYYKCLVYGRTDCSLPDSVSNYDLVMLKGWSISALGLLLFLIFMSIDVLKFWYTLFVKSFEILFIRKKPRELILIFRLVAYRSASKTLSHPSASLSLNELGDVEGEHKETEDDEEGDRVDEEENSSSSSDE